MLYDELIPTNNRSGYQTSPYVFREEDELFRGSLTNQSLQELIDGIRSKLNYRVTFHLLNRRVGSYKAAYGVRLPDSCLYTAIIYHDGRRYEIFSPRFVRQKYVDTTWDGDCKDAIVCTNLSRAVSTVCRVRTVTEVELIRVSLRSVWYDAYKLLQKPQEALQDVIRTHWFHVMERSIHTELLQAIDGKERKDLAINFAPESEVMKTYRRFDEERVKITEKANYIGLQKQVFVIQPKEDGRLWLVASNNNDEYFDETNITHFERFQSFSSVEDLPREVYRKMCTLDVEATREEYKDGCEKDIELQGVGYVPFTPAKNTKSLGTSSPHNFYLIPFYCLFVTEDVHSEIMSEGTPLLRLG